MPSRAPRFVPGERAAALLRPITQVRPGEAAGSLMLALDIFLVLTAYYLLKTVREPLILMGGGAEVKSYAAAGQALLLLAVVVPVYGALCSRIDRARLVDRLLWFFAADLALFYALARLKIPYLGVAFFLWVGIFGLFAVAQVWSLANDVHTDEQGRRLFPLIAVGGALGAVSGAWLAGRCYAAGVGSFDLMLLAGALLAGAAFTTVAVRRRAADPLARAAAARDAPRPPGALEGLRLIASDRYVLLIALLLFLTNFVNTNGEYILGRTVTEIARRTAVDAAAAERQIGGFYAGFYTWVNALTAALQLFLVSRVMRRLRVAGALFVLPLIAVGGYALIATTAALGMIRAVKILENATDYSLENTTRQALFLPTGRDVKYQAKQAVDTLCVRLGDVASAGAVFLGTALGFATRGFALLNVGLVGLWIAVAAALARRYRVRTRDAGVPERVRGGREAAPPLRSD